MSRAIPTSKNVRQGQTLYWIDKHLGRFMGGRPELRTTFLHSHKKELPPEGSIIYEMPVSFMREILDNKYSQKFFFSKKKAISYMRKS